VVRQCPSAVVISDNKVTPRKSRTRLTAWRSAVETFGRSRIASMMYLSDSRVGRGTDVVVSGERVRLPSMVFKKALTEVSQVAGR
jgi:hypothetical protein